MTILDDIGNGIAAFFSGLSSATMEFLHGAAQVFEANPRLQQIAMAAVLKLEDSAIAGIQKQAAAKSEILGQLAAEGLPVIESQINLAIETAVQNLAKSTAAVALPSQAPDTGSPVVSTEIPAGMVAASGTSEQG